MNREKGDFYAICVKRGLKSDCPTDELSWEDEQQPSRPVLPFRPLLKTRSVGVKVQ